MWNLHCFVVGGGSAASRGLINSSSLAVVSGLCCRRRGDGGKNDYRPYLCFLERMSFIFSWCVPREMLWVATPTVVVGARKRKPSGDSAIGNLPCDTMRACYLPRKVTCPYHPMQWASHFPTLLWIVNLTFPKIVQRNQAEICSTCYCSPCWAAARAPVRRTAAAAMASLWPARLGGQRRHASRKNRWRKR